MDNFAVILLQMLNRIGHTLIPYVVGGKIYVI